MNPVVLRSTADILTWLTLFHITVNVLDIQLKSAKYELWPKCRVLPLEGTLTCPGHCKPFQRSGTQWFEADCLWESVGPWAPLRPSRRGSCHSRTSSWSYASSFPPQRSDWGLLGRCRNLVTQFPTHLFQDYSSTRLDLILSYIIIFQGH